jgi:hypothetical protein
MNKKLLKIVCNDDDDGGEVVSNDYSEDSNP